MNCPYDQHDDDDTVQWDALYAGADLAFEPPRLALKAFGLLLLFISAIVVIVGFWLLVQALTQPQPYQDPEYLGAAVEIQR